MQLYQPIRAVLGLVATLCLLAPATAEDAGEATRSSGALSRQKPADPGRESDTREAMCLMIESAARARACRWNFLRA